MLGFSFLFRDFSISASQSWCPLSAVVFKHFLNSLILSANQVKTYSLLQGQLLFSSFLVTVSDQVSWEGHEYYLNGNGSHQFCTGISDVGSSTHTYILESIPIPRQKRLKDTKICKSELNIHAEPHHWCPQIRKQGISTKEKY